MNQCGVTSHRESSVYIKDGSPRASLGGNAEGGKISWPRKGVRNLEAIKVETRDRPLRQPRDAQPQGVQYWVKFETFPQNPSFRLTLPPY
jgi:hypothetical protein